MGNLHLVTGYAGQAHVTAADMASLFEALIRNGQFVMSAGSNFAAAAITNTQVRISDGELLMQGRHVKLDHGAYVDVVIENGEQGLLRHDLIVARYARNTETGIEDCSLVVIKGTSAQSDPADPAHTTGNINVEGATENDMPLYRVVLSGLSIESLDPLFTPQPAMFDAFLPLSGGTMTGPIVFANQNIAGGVRGVQGARIGGFRFDNNATYKIPLSQGKWSVLVGVYKNGGYCSLYFLAGGNGENINQQFKLAASERGELGFSLANSELTVTCDTLWSVGWYITNSEHADLAVG